MAIILKKKEECIMFEIGDYIIYGNHGVCEVQDIGTISLAMVDRKKRYYTLRQVYKNEAVIYAPIDNPKTLMRYIMTKEEAEKLINEIPKLETVWIANEKEREIQYKSALKTCDCRELIRIIKTLYQRKLERIKDGKKVTVLDERYFKLAEEQLYSELAFVMDLERNKVEEYLTSRIVELEFVE